MADDHETVEWRWLNGTVDYREARTPVVQIILPDGSRWPTTLEEQEAGFTDGLRRLLGLRAQA